MSNIKLFETKKVRSHWDADQEKWYFSIVDVVAVLTDSPNPQVYWRVLKKRLKDEGNETVTNCNALKMEAPDGKQRLTDAHARSKDSNSTSLQRVTSAHMMPTQARTEQPCIKMTENKSIPAREMRLS